MAAWLVLLLGGGFDSSATATCCQEAVEVDSPANIDAPARSAAVSNDQLFLELQNDKFQVREDATNELIKRGEVVLPEIAQRYFTAPPETVYRIRKILEGVGSSGDESTFLRATSLLLTLYSNGNKEMVQRIEILKAQWRKRRKDDAVKAILADGGKVVSTYNTQPQLRQALAIRQGRQVVSGQAARNNAKPKKLDVAQQKEAVTKIMANSPDENRNFILEHAKTINPSNNTITRQYTYSSPQPLSVQFPAGWVANERTLAKLSELDGPVALGLGAVKMNQAHWQIIKNTQAIVSVDLDAVALPMSATDALPATVRAITLTNYSLDADFCQSLGQFSSLGVLRLTNCKMTIDSVDALNQLKRVSTIPITFSDGNVDADSVSALAGLRRTRMITMKNAQVSPAALAQLESLSQISILNLSSMSINQEFFESLGRMKRLGQIQLSGCEFDIDAFQRLKSTGRVGTMDFHPKAFLGVGPQGGGRADTVGCRIAYIAPNSAAAREGIQVGDVIRKINGEPVKTFHEVRLRIAQYDPGEKMGMTIQRGGKEIELKVELGKNATIDR